MGLLDRFIGWCHKIPGENIRSKSVIQYLAFVCISCALWCMVTFNSTISMDIEIPVEVTSCPANVHFLSNVPDTLTVNVSNRGTAFLKYLFMPAPRLELKFSDYCDGSGNFRVEPAQLKKAIANTLSRTTVINSVLPGDISARYTDLPGKLVPVVLDMDLAAAPSHTLNGVVERSNDSVLVYGDSKTLKSITQVYTYHFSESGLTDTLRRKVTLAPINGAVIEPRAIEVMIPVERMVLRTQKVHVSVRNMPPNVNVIVFPSVVEVTYRAPMSYFNNNNKNNAITAVVDYNSININTPGNKVELMVGEVPGAFENVSLELDSVEYIIEKH